MGESVVCKIGAGWRSGRSLCSALLCSAQLWRSPASSWLAQPSACTSGVAHLGVAHLGGHGGSGQWCQGLDYQVREPRG